MNIAIHGEKELLVRLRDDLVEAGIPDCKYWNDEYWDICALEGSDYMHIDDYDMAYHNHKLGVEDVITITPSNYNEILNIIIERKDEKRNKV